MRVLLFVMSFLCVAFLSCSFSSQSGVAQNGVGDTVVCSERIEKDYLFLLEEREYFVAVNQDTSSYSCLLSISDIGINISWHSDICDKFFFNNVYGETDDTAAVDSNWKEPERKFRMPDYRGMLRELDLCLAAASSDYDLRALHVFGTFLSFLGDIAVLTTNNLNSHFVEKNGEYTHSDIAKALKMTSFAEDLNGILNKYGVEIDDISCQELRHRCEIENYLEPYKISKDIKVPDYVMDVEVIVRLKKLEKAD